MTDEYLPPLVRSVLAEVVPSTAAPASLRARVAGVPMLDEHAGVRDSLSSGFGALLRVAAVVTLVVGAGYLLTAGFGNVPGVGTTSTPLPPQFDPTIDGQGIVSGVNYHLRYAPWMIVALIAGPIVYYASARGRPAVLASLAMTGGLMFGAWIVADQPGVEFGNTHGPRDGIRWSDTDPPGGHDMRTFYVDVAPGENFTVVFDVTNRGSLPVTLMGVVGPADPASDYGPNWTAVALEADSTSVGAGEDLRPFAPVELRPGDRVSLWLVGRAGRCALGPAQFDGGAYHGLSIQLAFSVLGLTWVDEPGVPFEVREAMTNPCPTNDEG